jgi:hypothetical protein
MNCLSALPAAHYYVALATRDQKLVPIIECIDRYSDILTLCKLASSTVQ